MDTARRDVLAWAPGQIVDLRDHQASQKIIRGSGAEQAFVRGDLLFVSQMHSDKVEVFRIQQNPADPSKILTNVGTQYTGGITPQGWTTPSRTSTSMSPG